QRTEGVAGAQVHQPQRALFGIDQRDTFRAFEFGEFVGFVVAEHDRGDLAARLVTDPAVRVRAVDLGEFAVPVGQDTVLTPDDQGVTGGGRLTVYPRALLVAGDFFAVGVQDHHPGPLLFVTEGDGEFTALQ